MLTYHLRVRADPVNNGVSIHEDRAKLTTTKAPGACHCPTGQRLSLLPALDSTVATRMHMYSPATGPSSRRIRSADPGPNQANCPDPMLYCALVWLSALVPAFLLIDTHALFVWVQPQQGIVMLTVRVPA